MSNKHSDHHSHHNHGHKHKHHHHGHKHSHDHDAGDSVNWESVLIGNGPIAHFHGKKNHAIELKSKQSLLRSSFLTATAPIRALFHLKRTYKNFKTQDGYDETAQVFGQLFPGIGQPIATASALSIFTPLVVFGFFGMLDEYGHAKEELDEILHREIHTKEKLIKLAQHHDKWFGLLSEKLGIDHSHDITKILSDEKQALPLEEFAYHLAAHRTQEHKKLIASIGKKWGWTGIAGMGGMAAGMVAAIAEASIEINQYYDPLATTATMDALSISAGSLFLVGQFAMFCYAHKRAEQGRKTNKQISGHAATLHDQLTPFINKGIISENTLQHIDEIIAYQQKYIKGHAVEYGQLTKLGQALMMTGTAGNLGGITVAATLPTIAVGAAFTLGPALSRLHYTVNEKRFRGSSNVLNAFKLPYVKNTVAPHHPLKLTLRAAAEGGYETPLKEVEHAFNDAANRLAAIKALSLIHTANRRSSLPAEKRWEILNDKLQSFTARSEKGILQKTWQRAKKETHEDLEHSISKKAVEIIQHHKDDIINLYQKSPELSAMALLNSLANFLETDVLSVQSFSQCLHRSEEVNQKSVELLDKIGVSLKGKTPLTEQSLQSLDTHKFVRKALTRGKQTMKAIRFQLADSITTLSLSLEAQQNLRDKEGTFKWEKNLNENTSSKNNDRT